MNNDFIKNLLNKISRKKDANKNHFGHILIIGGDYGMQGSTILAAESCFRCGAGKVSVHNHSSNYTALLSRLPNAMTICDQVIAQKTWQKILADKTIIVIGTGLGQSSWSKEMLALALNSKLPKIIDADALNLIAKFNPNIDLSNCVITPHEGEASRLLRCDVEEIRNSRLNVVKKLYEKFNAISVLKGCGSLIYDGREIYECKNGNAGMATAGMGDVLSGMIAGFFGQNLTLTEAAILAVEIHAQAADLAAQKFGEISMNAVDLPNFMHKILTHA